MTSKPEFINDMGPDPIGLALGFGERAYHRFSTREGVGGLAKWTDERLDILAVHSDVLGHGRFREFIAKCKERFSTICIWEVWNLTLGHALERYGFHDETEIQGDGEVVSGMRWDKTTNNKKGQL